jgi:hypothetical protein
LAELSDFLARQRDALLDVVAGVPEADRDRRPAAGGWSIAEVLEHLRIVETGTATLLAKRAARAREAGVGADGDTSSVLGRLDHARVTESPDRLTAPELVRPSAEVRATDVLVGLETSRAALLDSIGQLDGVDPTRVTARHAVLGELDAYQWLLFVGQHEARHARQIARLGEALAGT